jgi:guanylate kinase
MGRLICIIGKSCSGKDTLFKNIMKSGSFVPVVPYTTRPKRKNERDGVDYRFVSKNMMKEMSKRGEIIESRRYNTVAGVWYYFTAAFTLPEDKDAIMITTPEGLAKISAHFGAENVFAVYLSLGGRELLLRAVRRESKQKSPNYAEVCRRFLADERDFNGIEENVGMVIDAGITSSECLRAFFEGYGNL